MYPPVVVEEPVVLEEANLKSGAEVILPSLTMVKDESLLMVVQEVMEDKAELTLHLALDQAGEEEGAAVLLGQCLLSTEAPALTSMVQTSTQMEAPEERQDQKALVMEQAVMVVLVMMVKMVTSQSSHHYRK
jgi:hypothetical protein